MDIYKRADEKAVAKLNRSNRRNVKWLNANILLQAHYVGLGNTIPIAKGKVDQVMDDLYENNSGSIAGFIYGSSLQSDKLMLAISNLVAFAFFDAAAKLVVTNALA